MRANTGAEGHEAHGRCNDESAASAIENGAFDTARSPHQTHLSSGGDARYLIGGLSLIIGFMVVEVIAAAVSGSLALLADAGHMLTDAGAIGASLWAMRLALRPARGVWTYGFKRAEILSAAGNGIALVVISALIVFESVNRLLHPSKVTGAFVLTIALIGVVVNLVIAWLLAKADRSSLNVEGSFQHILTDLYGFIATALAGLIIIVTRFERADAIASLIVVILMLRAAFGLLKASGRILLEASPENVDLDAVRTHLMSALHVTDIHDLHAWTVTSSLPALSAHVVIEDGCFSDGHVPQILDQLQSCLLDHFDVAHSTFQFEPARHLDHEHETH